MRTKMKAMIVAAMLGLVMTSLQACFEPADPNYWGPARQAHEQLEYNFAPRHEVCDAYGNNCMVCDADNGSAGARRAAMGIGRLATGVKRRIEPRAASRAV